MIFAKLGFILKQAVHLIFNNSLNHEQTNFKTPLDIHRLIALIVHL